MPSTSQLISLLWRDGQPIASHRADTNLARDLNIKRLVRSLSITPQYEQYVQSVILTLTTDIETIRYRQAILKDLLRSPALVQQLEQVLDAIITLESYLVAPQWKDNLLRQVAWRLSELERFVDTVVALDDILTDAADNIQSEGLQKLRQAIKDTLGGDIFQQLRDEEELRPLADAAICRSESDWLIGLNGTRVLGIAKSDLAKSLYQTLKAQRLNKPT